MKSLQIASGVVAVAGDRLVQILGVGKDGLVEVRDLVNGHIHATSANALRAAPTVHDLHGETGRSRGE